MCQNVIYFCIQQFAEIFNAVFREDGKLLSIVLKIYFIDKIEK